LIALFFRTEKGKITGMGTRARINELREAAATLEITIYC
jgi:hypothetical protein